MENQPPQVTPDNNKKILIFILLLVLFIVVVSGAILIYQNNRLNLSKAPTQPPTQQVNQSNPNLISYKRAEGVVTEINAKYITLQEEGGQKLQVFIEQQPIVSLEIIKIPAQQIASGSAKILSTVVSIQSTTYDKIRVGDKLKIRLDEKDNRYSANTITLIKEDGK